MIYIEQLKSFGNSLKETWNGFSSSIKNIIMIGAIIAIAVSVFGAFYLNSGNRLDSSYVVLYKNLSDEEGGEIYSALLDMGVNVRQTSSGEIAVKKDQADKLKLQLSSMGYPKSALSYDVFTSNAGFTTTELEKKKFLIFELQDRLQATIRQISGVENSVVTLNVPDDSQYVWSESKQEEGSASVFLNMGTGKIMDTNQVDAIKALVSSSVPKLMPENVSVVDSATGLELKGSSSSNSNLIDSLQRADLEKEMEARVEEKVINILTLPYDKEDIRVSASVEIDYDKIISEQLEYLPQENGNGVVGNINESASMSPEDFAGGVVGEENNTDIPIYVDTNGDGIPEYVDYQRSIEYLVSQIKTQIQRDEMKLTSATVSVMIRDRSGSFNEQTRDALIDSISKAANILPENISVNTFDYVPGDGGTGDDNPTTDAGGFNILVILMIIGAIAIIVTAIILITSKAKKAKLEKLRLEEEAMLVAMRSAEELEAERVEEERRKMKEDAEIARTTEDAVINDVKQFAEENPSIMASILKNMMKEEL